MRTVAKVVSCGLLGLVAARSAEWKPEIDGVSQLNAVEEALRKVEGAAFDASQKKAAAGVVRDVDKALADVRGGRLTKAEKKARVKGAIDKLQGLQSQWELAAVESSLQSLLKQPLAPAAMKEAKAVAAAVEATVEDIESGKLTGEEQHKKVGEAIAKLQVLQKDLQSGAALPTVAELERKLAQKKKLLEEEEKELQLAKLKKELFEKQAELHTLEADQREAKTRQVQQQEDAAQQAQIAKLVSFAKELVAAKASVNEPARKTDTKAPANGTKAVSAKAMPAQVRAILADLSMRAQKVSVGLAKMDAEEKAREAELQHRAKEASEAPVQSKKDALARAADMLNMLAKRQHRSYLKARALKAMELKELTDGVQNIKNGDLKGLSALLGKMEHESKSLQAKTKGFLH